MRQFIIAIFLLFSVAAYAQIVLIDDIAPKNAAFDVIVDINRVGDADTDSSMDMNDDGRIDLRRLELTGYFLHPALWGYIDTTTAKIPTATLADSANGGSARAQSAQGFRGVVVTDDTPADGEILIYEADSSRWIVGTQSGGSAIKWRDSSYIYLDTANILGGNTEIKAWLDTTAVRVPIADSTHGGATRATTSAMADSANGGSIRSETCKVADSCEGGSARTEDAMRVRGMIIAGNTASQGQVLRYTSNGDSLYWDNVVTSLTAGYAIDVTGSGAWNVALDSTEVFAWNDWNHTADSVDNWGNRVNEIEIIIEDSLDEYYDSTKVASRAGEAAHDTLWAHIEHEVVPLIFVHGHPGKPGDNDTTSLECFDSDSLGAYMFKMTFGAADQVDTVMLSATLPYKCTQGDSLIYKYATSSATATTIKIDAIKVSVEGVSQIDFATDRSSTATAYVRESLAADADYNEKEQVTVRFIVAGDSGAWLKVYTAFLVVSR